MLELGVIEPAASHWCSALGIVNKKELEKYSLKQFKFCVDFQALNSLIVLDLFPMPRTEKLIQDLAQNKCVPLLDLKPFGRFP